MKRLFPSLLALALVLSSGTAFAGMGKHHMMGHRMMGHHYGMTKCAKNQHWVKGYMRGKIYVHGYCRK